MSSDAAQKWNYGFSYLLDVTVKGDTRCRPLLQEPLAASARVCAGLAAMLSRCRRALQVTLQGCACAGAVIRVRGETEGLGEV